MQKSYFRLPSWSQLTSSGLPLVLGAGLSKMLGIWRNRQLLELYGPEQMDLILLAFRLPDFFYYALAGATLGVIFVPRFLGLPLRKRPLFWRSFWWLVIVGTLGVASVLWLLAPFLSYAFAPSLDLALRTEMLSLTRWLIGSVAILAITAAMGAYFQAHKWFWMLGLGPVVYMGSLCLGLSFIQQPDSIALVGPWVVGAAGAFFLFWWGGLFWRGVTWRWTWFQPASAWQGWRKDFTHRSSTNLAFQVNESADLAIANLIGLGSVTIFSIGNLLGSFLLSTISLPIAAAALPHLVEAKFSAENLKRILSLYSSLLLAIGIVFALIIWSGGGLILSFIFPALTGEYQTLTQAVMLLTAISFIWGILIPLWTRLFLAHGDASTSFYVSGASLFLGTATAALFSLGLWAGEPYAVLGLGIGTMVTNTFSAVVFITLGWRRYLRKIHSK